MALSTAGRLLAIETLKSDFEQRLRLFDTNGGALLATPGADPVTTWQIADLAFDHRGKQLLVASGTLHFALYDLASVQYDSAQPACTGGCPDKMV